MYLEEPEFEVTCSSVAPIWPALESLALSHSALSARREGIGGSDANIICSGDEQSIHKLWLEKRRLSAPEDLSNVLPVALGQWTEPFNRLWFERVTRLNVVDCGEVLLCPEHSWRRCTLDGTVSESGAVWEAKHTNAFARPDEVLARYMPQLQHNMAVARCETAFLSVIFGNHKYEVFEVAADWLYQLELLDAEQAFWECVVNGHEPVAAAPLPTPKPVGTREICLEGNNSWAAAAADWLQHRQAAKRHSAACATLKDLVEDDVARAFGHGIEARRSKSGAISIRELAR
jgi:predicted phage-related endonuclease